MRFDYSQEQLMLIDSIRRTLQDLPATSVKANGSAGVVQPDTNEVASALASVGLFSMMLPEEDGGLGLGLVDGVAAAIETGRAAVPFPAIECMAGSLLIGKLHPDSVPQFNEGKLAITAPVHGGLEANDGNHPTISGEVSIPFPAMAKLMVSPVSLGEVPARSILSEFDGATAEETDGIDLCYPVGKMQFSRQFSDNEIVPERIDMVLSVLNSAELLGAAEHCLEKSVNYLKEREQFGKVIGTFQSLKHIAADCQVRLDAMRASVEYAAAMYDRFKAGDEDAPTLEEVENYVHIAKAYCSEAAQKIARECIQLHGGIAFTWEYGLHVHFRRISRLAFSAGTSNEHFEPLAGIAIDRAANYGGLGADPIL